MLNMLQVGLFLHLMGLATLVGVTLAGFITTRQFRVQYSHNKQKGFAIMQAVSKLPVAAGIGLLLLIVSGVMMLAATSGVYGQQLWFRIKMIFVILIVSGITFLNARLQKQLRKWVMEDGILDNRSGEIAAVTRKIAGTQLFLFAFFIAIFILSVFRFN